jgi:hypothetical protein
MNALASHALRDPWPDRELFWELAAFDQEVVEFFDHK